MPYYNFYPDPEPQPAVIEPYYLQANTPLSGELLNRIRHYMAGTATRGSLDPTVAGTQDPMAAQTGFSGTEEASLRFELEDAPPSPKLSPLEEIYAQGGSEMLMLSGRTRGEVLKDRAERAGIELPEGMIAAIPKDIKYFKAYVKGALSAAKARTTPPVVLTPFEDTKPWAPLERYDPIDMMHLPQISAPVVEHIRSLRPHLVMAADRGARYFGLGVFSSWRRRYPDARFPTIDGSLHFGRLSRSVSSDQREELMAQVMMRSGLYAEMMQRRAEGSSEPVRVMLLDDWVAGERTINMARQTLTMNGLFTENRDFAYTHATMVGRKASGAVQHIVSVPDHAKISVWDDDNSVTGVFYEPGSAAPTTYQTDTSQSHRGNLRRYLDQHYYSKSPEVLENDKKEARY